MTTTLHQEDIARLASHLKRIEAYMLSHGDWKTFAQIRAMCGGSEAGISARLRELRNPEFGGYSVERRHVKNGLHEYRVSRKLGQGELF